MQTKAGKTFSKCVSWKEDTTKKVFKIRFLEEIIGGCEGVMTSVDMSRNNVSNSKYFQEETYDDLLEFICGVKLQREGVATTSAELTKKDLEEAVKELRNLITHYKYVKKNCIIVFVLVPKRHIILFLKSILNLSRANISGNGEGGGGGGVGVGLSINFSFLT